MPSRKISDLRPEMRKPAQAIIDACKARGVELLITCTLRSNQEQSELYAIGRTKPGRKVTNAKPGSSAHNHGCAMDVVPVIAGKPCWDASHHGWQVYGEEVRRAGLEWAGDWKSFKEFPHCQIPNWRSKIG